MLITQLTDEDHTRNANQIKEILLLRLEKENLLTKSAEEICQEYAVVMHRKGFFGRIIDKLFSMQDDAKLYISIVKILNQ